MNVCPRCRSTYMGKGIVCPACSGRPHSAAELKAVSAGPTLQTPEKAPVGLPHPSDTLDLRAGTAGRPGTSRTRAVGGARTTVETQARTTPAAGTRADDSSSDDPLIGQSTTQRDGCRRALRQAPGRAADNTHVRPVAAC